MGYSPCEPPNNPSFLSLFSLAWDLAWQPFSLAFGVQQTTTEN